MPHPIPVNEDEDPDILNEADNLEQDHHNINPNNIMEMDEEYTVGSEPFPRAQVPRPMDENESIDTEDQNLRRIKNRSDYQFAEKEYRTFAALYSKLESEYKNPSSATMDEQKILFGKAQQISKGLEQYYAEYEKYSVAGKINLSLEVRDQYFTMSSNLKAWIKEGKDKFGTSAAMKTLQQATAFAKTSSN